MTIDSTTGLINWTPTVAGDYDVTANVSDGDLFDSQSFTITVPPLIIYCDMTVYSQCSECYGYVWVNGLSTGKWISFNGAVTITGLTPGTTVSVYLVDSFGVISHSEIICLVAGNNVVTIYLLVIKK